MAFFITQLAECGLGVLPGCLQLARLQWGVRFPAVPFFQVHLPADQVAALRHASDFFSMDTVPRRAASSCAFRVGPLRHSGRCHATAAWGRDACSYAEPCMPAVRVMRYHGTCGSFLLRILHVRVQENTNTNLPVPVQVRKERLPRRRQVLRLGVCAREEQGLAHGHSIRQRIGTTLRAELFVFTVRCLECFGLSTE